MFLTVHDDQALQGNEKYGGYVKDVLDAVSQEIAGMKYGLYLAPDGKYGAKQVVAGKQQWNGMIGEIVRGVRIT